MATSYTSRLGTSPEEGTKAPCVIATTGNITLAGAQTIDSVAVTTGDRVLVRAQTDGTENGIYDVEAGSWDRATDWNEAQDVISGVLIPISSNGALYQGTWTGDYVVDTTEPVFATVSDADPYDISNYVVDTGVADAYVVTMPATWVAYTTGAGLWFKATNDSTGASTINVNGLGAKTIKKRTDLDIEADDIKDGGIYHLRYDGTDFQLLGMDRVNDKETVADLVALTGVEDGDLFQTEGYLASGDRGANLYLATTAAIGTEDGGSIIDSTGTSGIKFSGLFPGEVTANQWGYTVDGVTEMGTILTNVITWARSQGGAHITAYGTGTAPCNTALVPGSNLTLIIFATLVNTASNTTWHSYGFLLGQGNREDLGRSKGVEETAHSLGALVEGQTDVTIGLRWKDITSDFTNAANYTAQAGDLCLVCTTDDNSSPANPTAPVPSFAHHRRLVSVSGSDVVLDKGVAGAGTYMIIATSRDLGYDRSTYGGVGRMETIADTTIIANVDTTGFPMLTGGTINCKISGRYDGRAVIYGNGARDTVFNCTGLFSRNALELAFACEDYDVTLSATHEDTGQSYTTALLQTGERSIRGRLRRVRISAPAWNGNDAYSVFGVDHFAEDVLIDSGCTLRLFIVGSSLTPSDRFRCEKLDLGSTGAMTGRLAESTNSDDLYLHNVRLRGNTSNADATLFQDSGTIKNLEVVDDGGIIRINQDYLIEDVRGAGTVSTSGTRISRERVKPKIRSSYLYTETYAATFAPTRDFQMSLTGNLSLEDPSGTFEVGDTIEMTFVQDATASRSVTYAGGSLYRGVAAPSSSATASDRWTARFKWNGVVWLCNSFSGGWA